MVNIGSLGEKNNLCNRECFNPSCFKKGEYRAPKSKNNLNDYVWFCLDHIREFNKSWNYFEGMNEKQIEMDIRASTTWERPTWPINGNKKINFKIFRFDFETSFIDNENKNVSKNFNFNQQELKAFKELGINPTLNTDFIKTTYKKLVKKFHPDNNYGKKAYEDKIISIIESYTLLQKTFNERKIYE